MTEKQIEALAWAIQVAENEIRFLEREISTNEAPEYLEMALAQYKERLEVLTELLSFLQLVQE